VVTFWGGAALIPHGQTVAAPAAALASTVAAPASPTTALDPVSAFSSPSVAVPVVPGLDEAATRVPASVDSASVAPVVSATDLSDFIGNGSIPKLARAAYMSAATAEARAVPTCGLRWQILAGIGLIESDHARSGGSASPTWSGVANPAILGPILDGKHGYPAVPDTDHGVLDGDPTFDRAVGPMQFLPSTWREYAGPTVGKVAPNPENISDAAAAAGRYLCASGVDLRTPAGLIDAIYGYNHSFSYVTNVVSAADQYASGQLPGATSALAELPALVGGEPPPFVADAVSAPLPSPSASHSSATPSPSSFVSTYAPTTVVAPPRPAPIPQPNPTPSPMSSPAASSPPASASDSSAPDSAASSSPDSATPTLSSSPPPSSASDSPSPSDSSSSSDSPAPGSPAPGSPAPSPSAS
jgi:hypothetical protein